MSKIELTTVDSSTFPDPDTLFQIATGFWAFKAIAVAVEFDIFTKISGNVLTLNQLVKLLELPKRPTRLLVTACVALGLLLKTRQGYRNARLAEEYLTAGKQYDLRGLLQMFDQRLYQAWNMLSKALKEDKPQGKEDGSLFWCTRAEIKLVDF